MEESEVRYLETLTGSSACRHLLQHAGARVERHLMTENLLVSVVRHLVSENLPNSVFVRALFILLSSLRDISGRLGSESCDFLRDVNLP